MLEDNNRDSAAVEPQHPAIPSVPVDSLPPTVHSLSHTPQTPGQHPQPQATIPTTPSSNITNSISTTTPSTTTTTGLDDTADSGTTTDTASASSSQSSKRYSAKMAARAVSKPFRKSVFTAIAGVASTIGLGQAMYLKATYQSPPDARGPRSGVECPPTDSSSTAINNALRNTISKLNQTPAFKLPTAAANPIAGAATEAPGQNASTNGTPSDSDTSDIHIEQAHAVETPDVRVNYGGTAAASNAPSATAANSNGTTPRPRHRVLIIGDSLVSGVGGESSFEDGPSDGPALPRQVARCLSNLIGEDVAWNAISLTGGDVRMLRRKIIPFLSREKQRGTISDVYGVVLVTGVNDWKRFSPFRTATKFRVDLAEFIKDIQDNVNPDCKIFLPAIPGVRHTPRFHEPLRSIVIFLNELWDAQKLAMARKQPSRVYFIGQPANHEWGDDPLIYFSTLDRVHPSELGYRVWAERIARVMREAYHKANLLGTTLAASATDPRTEVAEHEGDVDG